MTQQRVTTYQELQEFLTESKATFTQDEGAQIVRMTVHAEPLPGFVFLRWELHLPYLQIICPMLDGIGEDRLRELAEALARVNHAIALPGFAVDFDKKYMYFRITLPYDAAGFQPELLRKMILATVNNARDFFEPFKAIAGGEPGAKILELVIEQEKKKQAKTGGDGGEWPSY